MEKLNNKRALILTSAMDKTRVSLFVRNYIVKAGYATDLRFFRQVRYSVIGGKVEIKVAGRDLSEYDLVYFRMTKREIYKELAAIISSYCNDRKIFFFDKIYLNLVMNNKLLETYYFGKSHVSQPDTVYVGEDSPKNLKFISKKLGFPIIAKRSSGQRGQGLYLLKTEKGLANFMKRKTADQFIYQKFIPNTFDWRIYVVDDKVILSERRTRNAEDKKEFRNNVSLGAKKDIAVPSAAVQKLAVKASKSLNLTFSGIDILENDGKAYVLEGNRAPAFKAHGKDRYLLRGLPDYIIENLRK